MLWTRHPVDTSIFRAFVTFCLSSRGRHSFSYPICLCFDLRFCLSYERLTTVRHLFIERLVYSNKKILIFDIIWINLANREMFNTSQILAIVIAVVIYSAFMDCCQRNWMNKFIVLKTVIYWLMQLRCLAIGHLKALPHSAV